MTDAFETLGVLAMFSAPMRGIAAVLVAFWEYRGLGWLDRFLVLVHR